MRLRMEDVRPVRLTLVDAATDDCSSDRVQMYLFLHFSKDDAMQLDLPDQMSGESVLD